MEGFGPTTDGLEIRCSVLLSYIDIKKRVPATDLHGSSTP